MNIKAPNPAPGTYDLRVYVNSWGSNISKLTVGAP